MRILFTSVGRRVELIQAFRQAAERNHIPLEIYGADITDTAPAFYFCDVQKIVCRISEKEYIPMLLDICKKEHIDALIPTIDTDLLILSQERERFLHIGTQVFISAFDKIKLCRDKRYTASYFQELGLNAPRTIDDFWKYDGNYPCFIKPRDGSSSVDAYKVNSQEDLKIYAKKIKNYVIQSFIEGTEYTVDIFCDLQGKPVFVTPRERMVVRSGEVIKTQICQDEKIKEECLKLIEDFKPCGPITVQLIREKGTDIDYYIEINPRYGGGAPLSMKAGADSAEAVLKILLGEKLFYKDNAACHGMVYSRYDQSVCVENSKNTHKISAVIFDLDDTLYNEKDYVRSGYIAVAERLPMVELAEEKLWKAFCQGKSAIDAVLVEEGIYTDSLKEECLDIYRTHKPHIGLSEDVKKLLCELRKKNIKLGIITDGRPEGQKNKIHALGLSDYVDEVIITDELGGVQFRKPNDIAFRIMQGRLQIPYEEMVYVGDNPKKDFQAPRNLGMESIYYENRNGLYAGKETGIDISRISSLQELLNVVC